MDTELFFSGFETEPDTPVRSVQSGRGRTRRRQNVTLDSSEDEGPIPFVRPQRATRPARGRGHGWGGVCCIPQDDSDSEVDGSGWTQDLTPPSRHPLTTQPGLKVTMPMTLLGFHQLFFVRELLKYLQEETITYAKYVREDMQSPTAEPWNPVSLAEMTCFLGMMMVMGFFPAPDIQMYWRRDRVYSMPNLSLLMLHTRFEAIHWYLHTFNRKAIHMDNLDQLIIMRPIVTFFRECFRQVYTPTHDLSLDEGMMAYKGRLSIKVYNPKKPSKYGIKLHMLYESKTWYVLD